MMRQMLPLALCLLCAPVAGAEDAPASAWNEVDELVQAGKRSAAKERAAAYKGRDAKALRSYAASAAPIPEDERRALIDAERALPHLPAGESEQRKALAASLSALHDLGSSISAMRASAIEMQLHLAVGDLNGARAAATRRAEAASAIGYLAGQADALIGTIEVAAGQFDYSGLVEIFSRLAAVREQQGNEPAALIARINGGAAIMEAGRYHEALEYLGPLSKKAVASKNPMIQQMAHDAIARAHWRTGSYAPALVHFDAAIEFALKIESKEDEARARFTQGCVWEEIGRLDKAEEAYKGTRKAIGKGSTYFHGQLEGNLGNLAWARGDLETAHAHLSRAIEIFGAWGASHDQSIARRGLGEVTMSMGRPEAALALFRRSAAGFSNDPVELAETYGYQARALLKLRNLIAARAAVRRGLSMVGVEQSRRVVDWLEETRARILLATGDLKGAIGSLRGSMDAIDRTVSGLSDEETYTARRQRQRVFQLAVEAAFRAASQADMLEMLERSRAASLNDTMGKRADLERAALPPELAKKLAAARMDVANAKRERRRARHVGKQDVIRATRQAHEAALETYSDLLNRADREKRAKLASVLTKPLSPQEVIATVGAKEAFAYFQVVNGMIHAVLLAEGKIHHVSLGDVATIRGFAENYRAHGRMSADRTIPPGQSSEMVHALRKRLFAPLPLPKGLKHLYLCPDDALTFLPWPLVVNDMSSSLVPSATALRLLRQGSSESGVGVLALGDPAYRDKTKTQERVRSIVERSRSTARHLDLIRLEGSGDEVRQILALAKEEPGSRSLLREDASELAFVRAVESRRWKSVHLACHGSVDTRTPRYSALALSATENSDGYFQISEIVSTSIRSDLVVLSACETGRGEIVNGEGLTGFPRALLAAGASRVLVSLWKVDDESTRALMVEFYRRWLVEKLGVTSALKLAQGVIRGNPKWSHPKYWAGWVVWGVGE